MDGGFEPFPFRIWQIGPTFPTTEMLTLIANVLRKVAGLGQKADATQFPGEVASPAQSIR